MIFLFVAMETWARHVMPFDMITNADIGVKRTIKMTILDILVDLRVVLFFFCVQRHPC